MSQDMLPITLLSGFSGAGKTSLLAHALTQESHGMKVYAVVETLAQVDALAAHPKCSEAKRTKPHQLEFPNNCMCVALAPRDLLMEVATQAKSGKYDCCIITDPGTSEPMKVATALSFAPLSLSEDMEEDRKQQQAQEGCETKKGGFTKAKDGEKDGGQVAGGSCSSSCKASGCKASQEAKAPAPTADAPAGPNCELAQGKAVCRAGCCLSMDSPTLMSVCRLDACVTVLDASAFKDDLRSIEEMADRIPEGDQRSVATLAVEMVEFADVIVINKTDLVKKAELSEVRELVIALNPCARIIEATQAAVAAQDIMCTSAFSLEKTSRSAGWLQALDTLHQAAPGAPPPQQASYSGKQGTASKAGITSFVYSARRPFHPGRLYRNFMRKYFLTRVIASPSDMSESEGNSEESDEDMEVHHEKEADGQSVPQDEGKNHAAMTKKCCGGKCREEQQQPQPAQPRQERASAEGDGMSVEGGSSSSDDEDEDGDMEEALADYAAARDTVMAAAKRDLGEVMRSKGFFWLATQHDNMIAWDHVGALLQVMKEGCWYACVPQDEWPDDEVAQKRILADFCLDSKVGDRRQEIVFFGKKLKENVIRSVLDSCQATDEEIEAGKEGALRDELFGGADEEGSDDEEGSKEEMTLEEAQEFLKGSAERKRSSKKPRT